MAHSDELAAVDSPTFRYYGPGLCVCVCIDNHSVTPPKCDVSKGTVSFPGGVLCVACEAECYPTETGAERYFRERMADPEYRAAYDEASLSASSLSDEGEK